MFDSNELVITEGNSAIIDITPLDEVTEEAIKLNDGDKVIFTIKTNLGKLLLQKVLTNEDYDSEQDESLNCVISPEETLGWGGGTYFYDCLLLYADGTALTFISSTIHIEKAIGKYTDIGGE